MKAGRELDALVAEKVMGMGDQHTVKLQPDGSFVPTGEIWYNCPEFSTDMADAWRVLRKAADLDRHKTITFITALRIHVAERKDMDYRITEYQVMIYMDPEDICNAMLEAHGVRTLPDWYYETGKA